jgi:hypothetical protein
VRAQGPPLCRTALQPQGRRSSRKAPQARSVRDGPGSTASDIQPWPIDHSCSSLGDLSPARPFLPSQDDSDLAEWLAECENGMGDMSDFDLESAHEKQLAHAVANGNSWCALHRETFIQAGFRYPVCWPLHYTSEEMRRLGPLPARCREIIAFFDLKEGRIYKEPPCLPRLLRQSNAQSSQRVSVLGPRNTRQQVLRLIVSAVACLHRLHRASVRLISKLKL